MQIKTYQGEYKIEYSIVNLKGLEEKLRIGAETYHPEKIRALLKLRKIAKLSDVSTYFDVTKKTFNPKLNETKENYLLELENIGNFEIYNIPKVLTFSFKSSKNVTEYGDIVVSKLRPYLKQIGFIFLKDKVYTTTELIPLRLKKSFNNSLSFYLYIYLMTNKVQTIFFWSQEGTNHPRFPKYILSELPLPIPSLSFRKQIKNLVLKAHEEKQKAENLYKEAEDILLEELELKNWKPKTKKIKIDGEEFEEEENISIRKLSECLKVNRFDAEYWLPKYDDFLTLLNNPKKKDDIELKNLSILVDYKKGFEVGSEQYSEEGQIPFIRVSNLNEKGINLNSAKYISGKLYNKLKEQYEPNEGEILFTKDATIGISYLLEKPIKAIISSGILRLIVKNEKVNKEYLNLVLNSPVCKLQINKTLSGAIIKHFKPTEVMNLLIPLLNQQTQSKISQKIQQSFKARRKSKEILEIAKRGVEIYIENDEQKGINYITEQL